MHRPRYQAIHDLATRHLDAVRKELGRLEGRRAELLAAVADADAALIAAGAWAGVALRQQYQLHWQARSGEIAALRQQAAAVETEIERTRDALREAHRRLAALDELRERERAAHQREELRKEQRRNDEFALTRRFAEAAA